jgi:hypothetical protein
MRWQRDQIRQFVVGSSVESRHPLGVKGFDFLVCSGSCVYRHDLERRAAGKNHEALRQASRHQAPEPVDVRAIDLERFERTEFRRAGVHHVAGSLTRKCRRDDLLNLDRLSRGIVDVDRCEVVTAGEDLALTLPADKLDGIPVVTWNGLIGRTWW